MNYFTVKSRFQGNPNYWIAPHTCLIKSEKHLTIPNQSYVKYWSYKVSEAIWEVNFVTHFYGTEDITPLSEEQANKLTLAYKLKR